MNVHAGPPRAMTRVTLRLVPLTPVHIGDGTELRPDEYFVEDPSAAGPRYDEWGEEIEEEPEPPVFRRFDPAAAIRKMSATERQKFGTALDKASLGEAAKLLRQAAARLSPPALPITTAALQEVKKSDKEVRPFVHSGGRPYIPGSSIKGAFRTALASAALPREARAADLWNHDAAMKEAFGLGPNDTSTDPLRFLSVSDSFLPEGATLIDRSEVVKADGVPRHPPIRAAQERTLALALEEQAPVIEVVIGLDGRAAQAPLRRAARFTAEDLILRTNSFHQHLFTQEAKRFLPRRTAERLQRVLASHKGPDGAPPLGQDGSPTRGFVLLRLGRFGHFESKSLEGVRRGDFLFPKIKKIRRGTPNEWGTTRTVTRDANNNPIPFGWVIGWVVKEERV